MYCIRGMRSNLLCSATVEQFLVIEFRFLELKLLNEYSLLSLEFCLVGVKN